MITGDNINTAINVASKCKMIGKRTDIWIGSIGEDEELSWNLIESGQDREYRKSSRTVQNDIVSPVFSIIPMEYERVNDSVFMGNIKFDKKEFFKERTVLVMNNIQSGGAIIALTGDAFHYMFENYLEDDKEILDMILQNTIVFARTQPEQKAEIVACMKKTMQKNRDNFYVGFCGDGANDCPALKKAHVGLSLSELEASIASPFTSSIQDISSVLDLILEGKASLETGFQNFKFICCCAMF